MKVVNTIVGSGVTLMGMIRNSAGNPYPTGSTPVLTLKKDFGDFGTISTSGVTPALYDPPKGTAANPDPRWNPGVDGITGFNAYAILLGSHLAAIGTYRAELKIGEHRTGFRIHVGSSVS